MSSTSFLTAIPRQTTPATTAKTRQSLNKLLFNPLEEEENVEDEEDGLAEDAEESKVKGSM